MNLSPNFTLEEATFSETATRLGIDNQPSPDQLENMKKAAEGMAAFLVRHGDGAVASFGQQPVRQRLCRSLPRAGGVMIGENNDASGLGR